MDSDPNAPNIIDERSTPTAGELKPKERYNTNYIVDNFTRQERRNRLIVAGLAAALVLSLGLGLVINSRHHPAAPPDGGAPTAESAH
jgi:hypothetical protein